MRGYGFDFRHEPLRYFVISKLTSAVASYQPPSKDTPNALVFRRDRGGLLYQVNTIKSTVLSVEFAVKK